MTVRGIWLGLTTALLLVVVASGAMAQDVDPTERASQLATQAAQRYDAGDVLGAIELFHEAMTYVPDPAFAFNLAQLYDAIGQHTTAYRFYGRYLELYPGAPNRTTVEERITELTQSFSTEYAHLLVTTDPSGALVAVTTDDQEMDYGPSPVDNYVLPGTITICARLEGYETTSTQRNAVAGVRLEVSLELAQPPEEVVDVTPPPQISEVVVPPEEESGGSIVLPIVGWSMIAVGLGLTGVGTYFWLDAQSKEEDYNGYVGQLRRNETIPLSQSQLEQLGSDSEDAATLGNLLGIPGVIVLAGGVAVLLIDILSGNESELDTVSGPIILPDGIGYGLSGRF